MKIDIRIVGDDGVTKMLQGLTRAAQNPAPLMRDISEAMLFGVQKNFLENGRPAWVPLKGGGVAAIFQKGGFQ
ncbi:MAG: hypothetical protein FWF41_02580 [Betaproteobacteria bacterium]|nr:hypothetical protein [Betaproteobacteria bacterium]